jgi:hypothetical protein
MTKHDIEKTERRIGETGIKKLSNMESNIVDNMRRYFKVSPGTEREYLEIAIIDASKRYFEEIPPDAPRTGGLSELLTIK